MERNDIIETIEREIADLTSSLTIHCPGSHMHGKLSNHPDDTYLNGKRDALIFLLEEIK